MNTSLSKWQIMCRVLEKCEQSQYFLESLGKLLGGYSFDSSKEKDQWQAIAVLCWHAADNKYLGELITTLISYSDEEMKFFLEKEKHLVDLDVPPSLFLDRGLSVLLHAEQGKRELDIKTISLFNVLKEKEESISFREVIRRLDQTEKIPCNENVLGFLLRNPHVVPKDWFELEEIVFPGTRYKDGDEVPDEWIPALFFRMKNKTMKLDLKVIPKTNWTESFFSKNSAIAVFDFLF